MSYYQYMQSVYRSCLPQLNRSLRSSSVERLESTRASQYYTNSLQDNTSRYMRAHSVGPTDYVYTSAMPFCLEADKAVERLMNRRRAASVAPVIRKPFTYTEAYQTGGTGYSAFDYKVMDYASRLDAEETTRRYINSRKDYVQKSYEPTSYRSRYDYYSSMKHETDFMYDRSSVMSDWHHYRKSKSTLEARNQRAKSPLATRELDRYYGTERRSSFSGDVSSGGSRDFRFYNYRSVPYFGGSDNYVMSKRRLRR
jgi:hypothetical protein